MARHDQQFGVALGAALRQLRKRLGLSQAEVGKLAGLSQRAVSHLERGGRAGRAATWERILGALGLDAASAGLIGEGKP
jgi:transcriptional regulator with XRE-family HTH domain